MVDRKIMGRRIKTLREEKHMKQADLVRLLEKELGRDENEPLALNTVSQWERGKSIPGCEALYALANVLGCGTGYLLGEYDALNHDVADISKQTGITVESVEALMSWQKLGGYEGAIDVIYWLIYDAKYNQMKKSSILSLLRFFFKCGEQWHTKAIVPKGKAKGAKPRSSGKLRNFFLMNTRSKTQLFLPMEPSKA